MISHQQDSNNLHIVCGDSCLKPLIAPEAESVLVHLLKGCKQTDRCIDYSGNAQDQRTINSFKTLRENQIDIYSTPGVIGGVYIEL